MQKFVVSRDESVYEAWPDLVQTESGKLICVFTECEHHLDRTNSRIVMRESVDRGRTWSEKKHFTEKGTKTEYFNCARISRISDGSLVVICDKILGHEEVASELYIWKGDKEGINWSEPEKLPFYGIVPDKYLQLKNGRIIVSAQFLSAVTKKNEQFLWFSDDNGKTWSDRVVVAADPRYHLCEVSILECGDNTLIAYLRENSHQGYDMMKVISYDNGETWSDIYNTPMDCGHRPVSGFLKDGRVMVTYRFIPCGTQNLFAAFQTKEAALSPNRQEKVRIMPIDYDRNPSPDLGYTGWTQFEDGEIYIVNYIKDDSDKAQIRGYSFYPDEIMFPETKNTTANVF